MDDLLHGDEDEIYGDKAYANDEKRKQAEEDGVAWRVNRKARRGRKLNCADKSFNRKSNRTRAKVEHAFGVVKNLWGYRKVRYKGLQRLTQECVSGIYVIRAGECVYGEARTDGLGLSASAIWQNSQIAGQINK